MAKFPLGKHVPQNVRIARLPVQPRTGPTINRGKGNNNAATPWKFIKPVEEKFGPIAYDLAASEHNNKAPNGCYFSEQANALAHPWHPLGGLLWLNPPFTNITPWARKCAEECRLGARILLLVPASVGANWYWDWVAPFADVYSVGRMVFDDCWDKEGRLITTVYPKDLILCHYAPGSGGSYADMHLGGRAEIIRWRWQDGQATAGG